MTFIGKSGKIFLVKLKAEVAELADAHDSKSCGAIHAGSIPAFGTKNIDPTAWVDIFLVVEGNRTPERCRATQESEHDREAVARPNFRKKI